MAQLSTILLIVVNVVMVYCQTDDFIKDIKLRISEEVKVGSYIGNLAQETNVGMENGFNFRIVESTYTIDPKTVISLNQTTGEITTKVVINREELCKNKVTCAIPFRVTVYKGSTLFEIDVNIDIEDINDNTPTFDEDSIDLELTESTSLNFSIPLAVAVDLDKGTNNGVEGYYITPQSTVDPTQFFSLDVINQPNGLSLRVIKALDREKIEDYKFLILAKDAGVPIRTGTLTVSIHVIDENDNKPIFRDSVLNITVTEDIAVGNVIVTLHATDIDKGNNGEVIYELAPQQTEDIYDHFAMNATSGELTVAKKLDYKSGSSDKVIYVVAKDQATQSSLSAQATIYIKILNIGNKAPIITLTYLMTEVSQDVILVSENATLDEAIVLVNVQDSDSGRNGNFSCVTYNTYFGLKEVSSTPGRKSYKVFVQHLLNRESLDTHNLTITCVDGGNEESIANFVVKLKDENDNSPKFSTYIYTAEINENNTYGAEILTVNATDLDIGENGRITYQIHDDSKSDFEVDNAGVIHAITSLDREKNGQKIFRVLAIDHGVPARSSTATVMLTILDVNDNKPVFTKSPYRFDVTEGAVAGTDVDQVTAIDEDQGDNKKVSYYILPQYADDGAMAVPFVVFEDGKIKTNRELDREQLNNYQFEVGVRDYGQPSLNNSVVVHVKVLDINDETPYFMFPSPTNNSVRVLNEVSDVPVTQVSGADDDDGINKDLLFFIVDGNMEEIFNLDSNSGKLYIVKYRHLTEDKTYTLNLSVYDKGKPPRYSKQSLRVTLMYSNATALANQDSDSRSYVTIVVTVVCITVLSSITIIVVICFLRKKDIGKCGNERKPFQFGKVKLTSQADGGGQQISNDKGYPDVSQIKGKKEVSFSLEEGDSFTSTDFKLQKDNKHLFPSRQTRLQDMPEENESKLSPPPVPRPSQPFMTSQSNYMENPELNVSHQREDSHSETSGETATSHDSGKGGSVEGDNHDGLKFDLNPLHPSALNPSAYIIKEGRYSNPYKQNVPLPTRQVPPKPTSLPLKTSHSHRPSATLYSDKIKTNLNSPVNIQNRTKNWCQNLDYNDSDYLSAGGSLNSYHGNQVQGHKLSYQEPTVSWDRGGHGVNTSSKLSPNAFVNHGYINMYPSYRTNSTRDDDETTTTSGSYTINAEDLDEDIARSNYSVSRVV